MISLEAFIHYENLVLFKKQLADPGTSDEQRHLLLRLLAKEEANEFRFEHRSLALRRRQCERRE
jgi:hypothetical protein